VTLQTVYVYDSLSALQAMTCSAREVSMQMPWPTLCPDLLFIDTE